MIHSSFDRIAGIFRRTKPVRTVAGALLIGSLIGSCSRGDELDPVYLPEEGLPMTFIATVAAPTRATVDGTWTGGESVAVSVDSEVRTYTAAADGSLTSSQPHMWTDTNSKQVRAWYCGDGSSAADGKNGSALPTSWTVATDQSGDGYAASDLLMTAPTELDYEGPHTLTFNHCTARIEVNIRQADDLPVTSKADIASVRIGHGNLATTGTYNDTDGTWTAGTADGTITPRMRTSAPDAGFAASYDALVIPQNMDGKELIEVTLTDGQVFYYTPTDGKAQFKAGKRHSYNITVYGDRIEVAVVTGGTWTEGSRGTVTSEQSYASWRIKAGDYYYSDGTWSDGGLRQILSDGTLVVADPKPKPDQDKTVIGLIFMTYEESPSRFEQDVIDSIYSLRKTHPTAYVLATKNAGGDGQNWDWATKDYASIDTPLPNVSWTSGDRSITGLANCRTIAAEYGDYTNFPAFGAACNHTPAAPANTTGWFLPACGTWGDARRGLAGADELSRNDVIDWLNLWVSEIPADQKTDLVNKNAMTWFWSSTEESATRALGWGVDVTYHDKYMGLPTVYPVRAVLVF